MTDDDRKTRAQAMHTGGPRPGEVYRHYKGGVYSIVARAIEEDTLEPLVVYHSNLRGTDWARTLGDFTADVEVDGRIEPRFSRMEG